MMPNLLAAIPLPNFPIQSLAPGTMEGRVAWQSDQIWGATFSNCGRKVVSYLLHLQEVEHIMIFIIYVNNLGSSWNTNSFYKCLSLNNLRRVQQGCFSPS